MIEGARAGRIDVNEGQLLHIVNVDGKQVCDFSPSTGQTFANPYHQAINARLLAACF